MSDEPAQLDTLAAAYASAGRFKDAVDAAGRAQDLATARGMDALSHHIADRLNLYRANRAFVASTQPTRR